MKLFKKSPLSIMKKGLIKSITFMILIGVTVFIIVYSLLSQYLNENITANESNTAARAATQISDYFSQISSYSFNLSNTYTIPNHALKDIYSSVNYNVIENNILSHIVSSKFLSSVEISNKSGETYSSGNPSNPKNYDMLIGNYINCQIYLNKNKYSESLLFEYLSEGAKFNRVNIIVKTSYLSNLILNDNTYVVNSKGDILLGNSENIYNINISDLYNGSKAFSPANMEYDKKKYNITVSAINKSDLYVISIISKQEYNSQFIKILLTSVAISVGFAALSVFAMLQSWNRTYKSIKDIIETLKYHFPNDSVSIDELSYINSSIRKTLELNQQSQEKLSNAVLDLRTAQARALYSQISPHFIANTLENIKSQSIIAFGMNNNISKSIVLLTKIIFEYTRQNDMLSTIKEEIDITKTFVELSNMKFRIPFSTEYDIEKELEDALIIKLTIQPFIENTVIHSFSADQKNQCIKIRIFWIPETQKIQIEIMDNGSGIGPENIRKIRNDLKNTDPPKDHIGIKNVDIRYKLLYGEEYGISDIESDSSGTKITLTVPYFTKENTKLKI